MIQQVNVKKKYKNTYTKISMKWNIKDIWQYSIETKSVIFRDLLAEVNGVWKEFYEILEKNGEKCEQLFLIVSKIDSMIEEYGNLKVPRRELTNENISILASILDDIEEAFDSYRGAKGSVETLSQELENRVCLERLEYIRKKTLTYDSAKKK